MHVITYPCPKLVASEPYIGSMNIIFYALVWFVCFMNNTPGVFFSWIDFNPSMDN